MSPSVTIRVPHPGHATPAGVGARSVLAFTERAFEDDPHARTVLSLAKPVTGVLDTVRHRSADGARDRDGLTEFDADDQATLGLYLITRQDRAMPRLWHTVYQSTWEGRRNGHEDEALECLKASLPDGVRATIVADVGFGDERRYDLLIGLGFDFVVRFRQDILLTEQFGDQRPASQWLHETGRARLPKDMSVTADGYVLPAGRRARRARGGPLVPRDQP
jgi:hypothetical protein